MPDTRSRDGIPFTRPKASKRCASHSPDKICGTPRARPAAHSRPYRAELAQRAFDAGGPVAAVADADHVVSPQRVDRRAIRHVLVILCFHFGAVAGQVGKG